MKSLHSRAPLALVLFAACALAACAGPSATGDQPETQAAAPGQPAMHTAAVPAAEPEADQPPMERHEASAECWMKYDKATSNLDAKAKLVDKCINEKMGIKTAAAPAAKPAAKPKPKPESKPKPKPAEQ